VESKINNQKIFFDLIKKVADYLPKEWRFSQLVDGGGEGSPELIGETGKKIYFRLRFDKPMMVSVTGAWPKIFEDKRYQSVSDYRVLQKGEGFPTINFNVNRKPEAIATDIKRRFLENYNKLHLLCLEKRSKIMKHRELISHKVASMELVAPVEKCLLKHSHDNPRLYLQYNESDTPSGEIFFNHRASINLELAGVSIDTTIKILALITHDVRHNKKVNYDKG